MGTYSQSNLIYSVRKAVLFTNPFPFLSGLSPRADEHLGLALANFVANYLHSAVLF